VAVTDDEPVLLTLALGVTLLVADRDVESEALVVAVELSD
jgi:hypothetical protein